MRRNSHFHSFICLVILCRGEDTVIDMDEDSNRSSEHEVDDSGSDDSVDDDTEGMAHGNDGMAEMMAKILHQQVHGKVE